LKNGRHVMQIRKKELKSTRCRWLRNGSCVKPLEHAGASTWPIAIVSMWN
jgi:hypothetical protein